MVHHGVGQWGVLVRARPRRNDGRDVDQGISQGGTLEYEQRKLSSSRTVLSRNSAAIFRMSSSLRPANVRVVVAAVGEEVPV